MIYDDGSESFTDTSGTLYSIDANGVVSSAVDSSGGYTASPGYATDAAEASKMSQFYPSDAPWWESLAKYGVSRAIDSHYKNSTVDKTANPATFAGQNGKTYTTRSAIGGGAAGDSGMVMIAVLAVVAFVALS